MELLHRRCCGLDVHKETVVACLRLLSNGKVTCVYRRLKPGGSDGEVRPKWRPNL
jgi:hypothetical protein